MKKISILSLPVFFTLVVLISLAFTFFTNTTEKNCGENVVAKGSSKIGGHFQLTNVRSERIDSKKKFLEPTLIYFGYSYCPDVCPFDLQRNLIAVDILNEAKIKITPVFITIDPERDTPDRLKEFSTFVHPKLVSLTGSKQEIDQVMKLFKVYGKKSNDHKTEKNNYLMDHSAFTYLMDSSGVFLEYFNRKTSAEEMAEKISCFLKA